MTTIRITVDGYPVETIGMAADRLGMDNGALTSALRRAGVKAAARLDGRTPLYLSDDVDRTIHGRPRGGPVTKGAPMDALTALRHYHKAYRKNAKQLASRRIAMLWMESMTAPKFREATIEQLERHAEMAAGWATYGYLPDEALPQIASGMTPELASAADPTTPEERLERLADRMRMLRD